MVLSPMLLPSGHTAGHQGSTQVSTQQFNTVTLLLLLLHCWL
jgi:hypothetical protein